MQLDKWQRSSFANPFEKAVPLSPVRLLMRAIIEFNGTDQRKIILITEDKIKVLCIDPIERGLVSASTRRGADAHNIRHANFAEYPEICAHRLFKHSKQ